jgi:hypothetical protein
LSRRCVGQWHGRRSAKLAAATTGTRGGRRSRFTAGWRARAAGSGRDHRRRGRLAPPAPRLG